MDLVARPHSRDHVWIPSSSIKLWNLERSRGRTGVLVEYRTTCRFVATMTRSGTETHHTSGDLSRRSLSKTRFIHSLTHSLTRSPQQTTIMSDAAVDSAVSADVEMADADVSVLLVHVVDRNWMRMLCTRSFIEFLFLTSVLARAPLLSFIVRKRHNNDNWWCSASVWNQKMECRGHVVLGHLCRYGACVRACVYLFVCVWRRWWLSSSSTLFRSLISPQWVNLLSFWISSISIHIVRFEITSPVRHLS